LLATSHHESVGDAALVGAMDPLGKRFVRVEHGPQAGAARPGDDLLGVVELLVSDGEHHDLLGGEPARQRPVDLFEEDREERGSAASLQ
jgi:hypothetical protein